MMAEKPVDVDLQRKVILNGAAAFRRIADMLERWGKERQSDAALEDSGAKTFTYTFGRTKKLDP